MSKADITTRNTGKTAALWAGGVVLSLLVGAGLYLGAAHTVDVEAQARFLLLRAVTFLAVLNQQRANPIVAGILAAGREPSRLAAWESARW